MPRRIHSYYQYGSYASDGAVATSDLDVCLISRGELTADEVAAVHCLAYACGETANLLIELLVLEDRQVLCAGHYRIQAAGVPLYGDDEDGLGSRKLRESPITVCNSDGF